MKGCVMTHVSLSSSLAQSDSSTQSTNVRSFEGKAALVTGSTSGIGLAIAEELAAQGAMVALNGFGDRMEIDSICQRLRSRHGIQAHYDDTDVSKTDAVSRMVAATISAFGRLDILVNNAGIQHVAPIEDFPAEKWDAILSINLSAAFHATRAALPGMRERGWGRIVNVASAHGLVASAFKSAYVAAKHGVVGLTKVTALEAAEAGITCNAVCPGYVWTPLVEKQVAAQAAVHGISPDEVIRTVMLAEQPTRRFATVEEIAGVVAFLCGPAASSITGAAIPVDGGWTAH
jgi:3-hydroxybutyrate dehydrogenase